MIKEIDPWRMVKRYDQWHHRDAIDEMENGDYVLHSDYAALAERCKRLEAALRNARLTMLAASDILEHEYLHPILEADVNDSIERIDTALSTGAAP